MLVQVRLAVALLAGFLFTGCDLLTDSTPRPWSGYAWHRDKNRLEYWFVTYETQRDCIEAMRYRVRNPPQNAWYSEPVDGAYHGNNYFRVWIINSLSATSAHFECVVRNTQAEVAKMGISYGPILKGQPRTSADHYCV